MLRVSSISSFRRKIGVTVAALAVVVVSEARISRRFDGIAFNHEVDELLARLDQSPSGDYLVLGDSVLRDVTQTFTSDMRANVSFMATNGAIGMVGQRLLYERYIASHSRPLKGLVIGAGDISRLTLDRRYTENYLLRGFTRPTEIASIFASTRDPTHPLLGALYGTFPSFRHRLKLQRDVVGIDAAKIYTGGIAGGKESPRAEWSLVEVARRLVTDPDQPFRELEMIVRSCAKWGTTVVYLAMPGIAFAKPETEFVSGGAKLDDVAMRYPNFSYTRQRDLWPGHLFRDWAHLTDEGIAVARGKVQGALERMSSAMGND